MLYLTTHSTHYLRLYGVGHMVKDHSDSERGNPLPPHRLLFSICSKGYFICTITQTVVEHWLEREIVQWVHPMKDRSIDPSHHERTLLPRSYIYLRLDNKGRGMCYPVCGMMHIKEPLLLIGKSSPCGGSGFPLSLSEWSFTICLTPYNRVPASAPLLV